jgi:5-hydroxyisourate hydrolase-like protein (transthyretin family)
MLIARFVLFILCSSAAIAAQQKTGLLKGKVEDEKGKPIASAEVRATRSSDRSTKETYTDESGRYSLELEPGEYIVSFDAEGYQGGTLREMQQVEAGKETHIKTVKLTKAKRISLIRGAVFDLNGFSLAGARVRLERIPTEEEEKSGKHIKSFSDSRITNNHGEFAFRLPGEKARYRVTAILDGYKPDTKIIDIGESQAVPVALTLEPLSKK